MVDDASNVGPWQTGARHKLYITRPMPQAGTTAESEEEFEDRADAEKRKADLEAHGCSVRLVTVAVGP